MRTRSSASSAALRSGRSTARVEMPSVIVSLGLAHSRCAGGATRTGDRDARKNGLAPDVNTTITVTPSAATTNTVAGGVRNSVATAGAVMAAVKYAIADSGIASLRWTRSPISYTPIRQIVQRRRGRRQPSRDWRQTAQRHVARSREASSPAMIVTRGRHNCLCAYAQRGSTKRESEGPVCRQIQFEFIFFVSDRSR